MNKKEILDAVRLLGLDPKDYIVIGSGILAALNLREVADVDLIVSEPVFRMFEQSGEWRRKNFDDGTYYLVRDDYEVGLDWDSLGASPNLDELKEDQLVIDSIPFISISRLKSWKLKKGRQSDLKDIGLIDKYLAACNN